MADRNQQGLVNGTPPQMVPMNPNIQQQQPPPPQYFPQPQISGNPPRADLSQNSNQLQKPSPSMVNGQISPTNIRNPNLQSHSGQLTNHAPNISNDNKFPQSNSTPQTYQPSPYQMNKPIVPFPGVPTSKPFQNTQPLSQPNASIPDASPGISVNSNVRPPTQPNYQYTQVPLSVGSQPSPLTSRPNQVPGPSPITQPPTSQPIPNAAQRPLYQQSNKINSTPPVSQYPPMSTYPGAPPVSKPPTMTPTGPLRPPPGPITSEPSSRPPNSNPYPNYLPPSSLPQEATSSPLHQGLIQGSHPSPLQMNKSTTPQYPNVSQSFPLPPTQPPVQTNRLPPGIPQGYQLTPSTIGPPPIRKSSNTSNLNDSVPTYNQNDSLQGTPTYQNKLTPNRPPLPNEVPSAMSMPPRGPQPPQPLTANRMPSGQPVYGNSKYPDMNALSQNMGRMSVTQQGFNKLWGIETVDLLQCRNVLPPQKITPPPIRLQQEFLDSVNCSPEIFCCTMNKIPETNNLLQKSRLPLGILIHPFRDLNQLAVIQCSSIVRCRACRTYINPFVYFVDNKRWKCNLCFRVNELPDEFQYDPVSKTYGDPSRRPEIRSSTIEFIAPSEYMLRPPQPAIYLFVLDISRPGCDTGYLETLCTVLLEELDNLPGDGRTQIGFILFDSSVHFFSIAENYNQAHEMIVTDIDDIFLPTPDSLLVNLNENKQLIKDLLLELPRKYAESYDTDSALGPALQAAYKLMTPIGGRITVFQSCLPNKGPGALSPREDPNQRSSKDVRHLGPQTDFYKRLSLDCSTQQISVDLFLVSSQYSDLATLGGISQFSGGCIYYFPLFRKTNIDSNEKLARTLRRYLTRKIGFEAVMRVRCSRGLSIHTFHGNFFVRSTDLLSLPNVNPDAGFGMQVAIEDSLCELQCVCFQAAVLYTSAKGERRIRVHTLCLPVSSNLSDILNSADQQAIIGLLAKMAVDRSLKSSLSDAREAFINVAIDILSAYKLVETSGGPNTILAPLNLSLIPLYILALLKSTAFRTGQNTRLDDRVYAMMQMKTLPLRDLIQSIHPDLYHVTQLDDQTNVEFEEKTVAQPARLSLSSEHLDSRGAFLLDTPEVIYLLVGKNIAPEYLINILDVTDIRQINDEMVDLPELDNEESEKLRHFINYLQSEKPWPAIVKVITEPAMWHQFLINDKAENALSYYELLHHVKAQMK